MRLVVVFGRHAAARGEKGSSVLVGCRPTGGGRGLGGNGAGCDGAANSAGMAVVPLARPRLPRENPAERA